MRSNPRAATWAGSRAAMLAREICYTSGGEPPRSIQNWPVRSRRRDRSLRPFPYPYCRVTLAATRFATASFISHRPLASRFQRIAALLTFYPSLESGLIHRQVEHLRPAEQFGECLHHFRRGGKDNLVHGVRLALASVCIKINPASVRAEHKHARLGHRVARRNARLGHQIGTAFAAGTEIQNLCISIVIGNRPHANPLVGDSERL